VWFSDIYKKKYPTFVAAAHKNCCQRYRTDYFYHSIIDGAHIQTDVLDTTLSIFR
jgi:glucan phosphoethanolaminetransferase (alkaline phosphatase superfamily)